jgi:site-specific DNA recombinase
MGLGTITSMRVALYLRVSSPHQVDGISLEDQEFKCREYAQRQGWTVVAVYIEAGRSAFTEKLEKRVAFQQMLSDVAHRKFDVVLVDKLNRFARKVLVQYQAAAAIEQHKAQIASVTESIDRKTASGRLTFGMLAVLAEAQSDQLSEKMRDTRLAEARQGRHAGPVPVGFTREKSKLIPNVYLPAVKRAFHLYATRQHSFTSVCDTLTQEGFRMPDGRLFTKFQVAEMLHNPIYIGRIRHYLRDYQGRVIGSEEYEGTHEAVIDQEIWNTVQAEIVRRAAKPDHSHRIASAPPLLSGLARCSNCDAPMWRSGNKGAYYGCSGRLKRNYLDPERGLLCNLQGVLIEAADAHTLASLAVICSNSDILSAAAKQIADIHSTGRGRTTRADPQTIKELIRRADHMYAKGRYTDTEYDLRLTQLQSELELAEAQGTGEKGGEEKALALLNDIPSLLARATPEESYAILLEVFDAVYLTPHQVIAVRPAAAYAELLKEARERLVWWAGWVSGRNCKHTPPDPDIRGAASESRAGKRRWITNTLIGYTRTHAHWQTLAFL